MKRFSLPLLALLVLALAVRAYKIDLPFVEPYNSLSRQSICASVARNFYKNGLDLTRPEIDENGKGPYLYNAEVPLYSYVMAVGYTLAGGPKEGVARAVSVAISLIFLLYLWLLLRRIVPESPGAALAGTALCAFSPLVVSLSRSIQPEMTLVAASTAALYHFHVSLERGRSGHLAAACAAMALAVATKIFALHLAPVLVAMAWRRQGAACLRKGPNLLLALSAALPLLWYLWMYQQGKVLDLKYDPYAYVHHDAENFRYWHRWDPASVLFVLKVTALHLLTPAGAVLAALGVGRLKKERIDAWVLVWMGAAALYMLGFWPYFVKHSYYQISLAPVFAVLVALGWQWTAGRLSGQRASGLWRGLAAVLVVLTTVNALYFYRLLYQVPADRSAIVAAGREVQSLTDPKDLIVASYGKSPIQLYYCDRKGWAFDLHGDSARMIETLEKHRADGAAYFVTTRKDLLSEAPAFDAHLRRYRVIRDQQDRLLVDLRVRSE